MPISIVQDLLQPRLVDNRHDSCILVVCLLKVEHLIVTLYVIITPSFYLSKMLFSGIGHSTYANCTRKVK